MEVSVDHPISFIELHNQLAVNGAELLVQVLEDFDYCTLNSKKQDESLVSKAPKIKVDMARIDWKNDCSSQIFFRYLAFGAKVPLYSIINGKKIQFLDIEDPRISDFSSLHDRESCIPGSVFFLNSMKMYVKTKNSWLCMKKMKVQDKRESDVKQFYNGYGPLITFGI